MREGPGHFDMLSVNATPDDMDDDILAHDL